MIVWHRSFSVCGDLIAEMYDACSLKLSGIEVLLFCGTKLRHCLVGSRRFDRNLLISFSRI